MGSLNTPATLFCWKSDSSSLSIGLSWCGERILEKPVYRAFRQLPFTHLVAHSEICVKGFMSVRPCAGLCRVSRHEGAWLLAFPSSLLFCIDPVLCFFFFFLFCFLSGESPCLWMQLQLASSDWGLDLGGLDDWSCEATQGEYLVGGQSWHHYHLLIFSLC